MDPSSRSTLVLILSTIKLLMVKVTSAECELGKISPALGYNRGHLHYEAWRETGHDSMRFANKIIISQPN